jgi:DNA-binding ferritin-like protein (Dps family)
MNMPKAVLQLVVGNLEEKRAYRGIQKRVNALPKDYRFTLKKIQHYLYNFDVTGCDPAIFTDLVSLFETSAQEGKSVLDVIGGDAAAFCDELIRAASIDATTARERFNQEIYEHFYKEGDCNAEHS